MENFERASYEQALRAASERMAADDTLSWPERRKLARALLEVVNAAWWQVHEQYPNAYQADLARLNDLAGWIGEYRQVPYWEGSVGSRMLMPPKFFGGDPVALIEEFVASMSLNHAVLASDSELFRQELADQQSASTALLAHTQYFRRSYAYKRFFVPRAVVLRAYADHLKVDLRPEPADWRSLNHHCSFYIECFATRSKRFKPPPRRPSCTELASSVFVCALNSLAHQIVLRLLRPRVVLLSGRASWETWPDSTLSERGVDKSTLIRSGGKRCGVYRLCAPNERGEPTTVIRTNFIRTVFGPNSDEELRRLGQALVAAAG